MSNTDPYHDNKIYHKGIGGISTKGGKELGVIALCRYDEAIHGQPNAPVIKPVDLKRELWTLRDEAVTCPACRAKLKHQSPIGEG